MSTDPTLADFAGIWTLTRDIIPTTGAPSVFAGQAVWTWAPTRDALDYIETGTLTVPGATPMRATRRYRWGADMSVCFDDGRFFHRVPVAGGGVAHDCAPDTYRGHYDFDGWQDAPRRFAVSWQVCGPRKNYAMHSIYTQRAPD